MLHKLTTVRFLLSKKRGRHVINVFICEVYAFTSSFGFIYFWEIQITQHIIVQPTLPRFCQPRSQPKYQIASTSFTIMPDIILTLILTVVPNTTQYRHPHVDIRIYETAYTQLTKSWQVNPHTHETKCLYLVYRLQIWYLHFWVKNEIKLIRHDRKCNLILIKILIKLPLMLSFFEGYIQCWWAINQS